MRRNIHWIGGLSMALALLAPVAALADTPPSAIVIGNGVLALGVDGSAGLAQTGIGLQLAATSADGLAHLCACNSWGLSLLGQPLTQSPETFTYTSLGARS